MTQGVFTAKGGRFPSKKALREAVAAGENVSLEATSLFGNEYGGRISEAPEGDYFVVGPDPHNKRVWYAQITIKKSVIKIK
jgi:hypothetical protein